MVKKLVSLVIKLIKDKKVIKIKDKNKDNFNHKIRGLDKVDLLRIQDLKVEITLNKEIKLKGNFQMEMISQIILKIAN